MSDPRVLTLAETYTAQVALLRDRLQSAYDAHCAIESDAQRAKAEALLARIGTDDWRGEGYASPENQRDLSIRFHWGHDHRFAPDLAVQGKMADRHVDLMAQFITGFGLDEGMFAAKSVLDVGCWTGGTTLMLKTLGAGRILAVEEVRKYAETAHALVHDLYGHADVRAEARSLFALTEGTFDAVYFPGVVYHLSDPVLGLRRLFNRLHDGGEILVESAGIDDPRPICLFKGNREHHGGTAEQMNRSGWAWFWPSPACLASWLDEAGFEDVRVFLSPTGQRVYGHARRRGHREITRAGLSVPDID
ncbi:DUF1698 domain-containing protein [Citreimonas sp.]|uniref:DUF1698 domain-containing protein n=1 Tax=Citreimonas sp. TaxID=3036715 RepID=UPI0035C83ACD